MSEDNDDYLYDDEIYDSQRELDDEEIMYRDDCAERARDMNEVFS